MTHSGRLPPLQVIGRSQCIELDDPPDIEDEDIDDLIQKYASPETAFVPPIYKFTDGDGEETATALAKVFRVVQPGSHVCKRQLSDSSSFTHCRQSVSLAAKYAELRHVLEKKAQLKLVQDYSNRVQEVSVFVNELQNLVFEEYLMWQSICQNSLQSPPNTKLESLGAILEDLRLHTGHWNSLKQRIHSDPWLSSYRHTLVKLLEGLRQRFVYLRDVCLWWVDRLIHVGLKVLAHCDLERLSPDALWTITRGLEDYNTLLVNIKLHHVTHTVNTQVPPWSLFHVNNLYSIQGSLQPIQFHRILNILACERAHYAASTTQQFFTSDSEFLSLILKKPLPAFDWSVSSSLASIGGGGETSDYCTGSGSQVSLSASLLQVGQIFAPDLSQNAAPLFDFSRRENTFARRFLQIVFHSTSLLKAPLLDNILKSSSKPSSHTRAAETQSKKEIRIGGAGKDSDTSQTFSRSDPKRKSVSWGDAGEMSVIQMLNERYMDLLWQYTRQHLLYFIHNAVWSRGRGVPSTEYLGSMDLCPVTARMLIVRMIQQTSLKDIFPVGVVPALHSIAQHMQSTAAWSAWDKVMCSALGSKLSDKCYPTPLVDREFCSKTAVLLRNLFHPLIKLLHILDLPTNKDTDNGDKTVIPALLLPTLQRLRISCDLAFSWCSTKSSQFLASQAISPYLLVTQSDLKLLINEAIQARHLCQYPCCHLSDRAGLTEESLQQLAASWNTLNTLCVNLQVLLGSSIKDFQKRCYDEAIDFLQDEMPPSKTWKKKPNQGTALSPSHYATQAVQTLLEPVLAAVGQLPATSRLSVMSVAVSSVCEAWLHVILRNKIRFSLQGASQLETDFTHIRHWLQTRLEDGHVRTSVLSLDVFKHMSAVIGLLQQQPGAHTQLRGYSHQQSNSLCCAKNTGSNTVDPYQPSSSNASSNGASFHGAVNMTLFSDSHTDDSCLTEITTDEQHAYKVPNPDDWLALRLHGGSRSWIKLPDCLHRN